MDKRVTASIAAALLAVAFLLPLYDLTQAQDPRAQQDLEYRERWWPFHLPYTPGDSFYAIMPTHPGGPEWLPRWRSATLGLAIRDVAGGTPSSVYLPTDTGELSAEEGAGDWYSDVELQQGFYRWMLAETEAETDYDVVLSAEEVEVLEQDGTFRQYAWGVVALVPEEPSGEVVLHTDPERRRVWVLPLESSPVGDEL